MLDLDQEILDEFVTESREGLADIEGDLLAIEAHGANIDLDLVNKVFRAIHSMKGAAGFIGLETLGHLAHSAENVLCLVRERTLVPTTDIVNTLLKAADRLRSMLDDVANSNGLDINDHVVALHAIIANATSQPVANDSAKHEQFAELPNLETVATVPVEEVSTPPEPIVQPTPVVAVHPEVAQHFAPTPAATSAAPSPAVHADGDHGPAKKTQGDTSIRVSVGVLDRLMNLAGELVLGRNQLLQAVSQFKSRNLDSVANRLDQVTSELQETIMQTRMQPVGNVFTKFTRIVRDLGAQLKKDCRLTIEGQEVELDKTIIEGIGDPLTHLIRNAVDHGLETPDVRVQVGKDPVGNVMLKAYHQEGKVFLEVSEDGRGIDPVKIRRIAVSKGLLTQEQADLLSDRDAIQLIFKAGFSTAEKVSDVSGRGVGMDVVKTNIERMGGTVEIDTVLGKGTTFRVQLPLTMAIIPSLIVKSSENWYALPQLNVSELVRIRSNERAEKIHHIRQVELLRLRGAMLPLVRLRTLLNLPEKHPVQDNPEAAINVVVLQSGAIRYGLIVDALGDPEEIVVKPLGRHLQDSPCLAGATVLGDGSIALILDIVGVAQQARIEAVESYAATDEGEDSTASGTLEMLPTLIFTNHPNEQFAVPMNIVDRIERVKSTEIDHVAGMRVLNYRGESLPILALSDLIDAEPHEERASTYVIIFTIGGREMGLLAPQICDIRDIPAEFDAVTFRQPGILGSQLVDGKATRIVDPDKLAHLAHPDWFENNKKLTREECAQKTVLFCDDSPFFRTTLSDFLTGEGFQLAVCEDGLQAWQTLNEAPEKFDIVLTDIEMPNWTGYQLCEAVRRDPRFCKLPVVAISTLSTEADVKRGLQAGFNDYLVKLNRDQLRNSLNAMIKSTQPAR